MKRIMRKLFSGLSQERASVMAEALVLTVVLATMAAFMLKWTLGRHAYVAKTRRNVSGKSLVEACMAAKAASWQGNLPANGTTFCNIDGRYFVNVVVNAGLTDTTKTVIYSVNTD